MEEINVIQGRLGPTIKGFDYFPWTDSETVLLWDCKFACCSSEEQKDAIRYPYSWVLVHSRQPDDIYRGVTMLKDSIETTSNPTQKKKEMYLRAVGLYRCQRYTKSAELVDMCLEIKPDCWKSLFLKEAIAYRRKKTEPKTKCILVDSAATPVEFVTGILTATTSRSSYPTWGIENVPNWMRPVTLKKSIQHTIEIDASSLWVVAASAAVGFVFAAVFFRSK
ncbi:mitochondrial fission 1 protein A [Artemisia annua]|uniref:Mitochondrial fission 1 protein A n=1 Tax=Artemisia annua TaxID=35608 RepID=A0A2U1LI64_ARTAN|nr:mitochondrial fission 1 protein A [Artemisia annua]